MDKKRETNMDSLKNTCSLCGQIVAKEGKKRHEEWHNAHQPFVARNKIWGKVEWV